MKSERFGNVGAIPIVAMNHPDARATQTTKVDPTRLFGMREDDDESVTAAFDSALGDVAAIWPTAMAAQVVAGAAVVFAAAFAQAPGMLRPIGGYAAIVLLVSIAALLVLVLPAARAWPVHQRSRVVALGAAGLAAGLFSLLWVTARLPVGPVQLGALVAVAGAIGITTVALNPVRAATLGFGSGLVLMLAVHGGIGLPLVVASAFLICLGWSAMHLARLDHRSARQRTEDVRQGRFATRMITEFESHGTGWFWETDRAGRLTYLSAKVAADLRGVDLKGFDPTAGDPARAMIGRALTDLFRMDRDATGTERTLAFHLSSRTSFAEYSVCAAGRGDGEQTRWWSISGRPMIDDLGRFHGFVGSGSDLTERRRSEAEITKLALFDSLTGLANRQRMRRSLDTALSHGAGPFRPSALLLLDLDRFKAVNDTLGHQAGDALLIQVAERLQREVGGAGLVGRLGGDEFQILVPGEDKAEPLAMLARRIIAALSQTYFIGSNSTTIGCSIGVAIAGLPGTDSETLIRNADLALYAAKGDGRGVHRFYSDEMLAGAQTRRRLEDDLRQALAAGEFHMAYQPVVSTSEARITGYEALLRWNHPTRGAVSPADFIPVAEECGLIEAIGEWAMRTATIEASRWPGSVRVAVNVSPIQFANPAFPSLVTSALARSGLAPGRLELEITEGVFLNDSGESDRMFKALKGLGVRLALDDFGTGYSSLGYLRTAPFDKIKIDQSFVKGAATPGNRNAAIVAAIVTLAGTLGMETTAEGVEVQDEIDLVRALGCTHVQGYVYGKAARADEVMRQLSGAGGPATASGYKASRSPRTKMLRSARISIRGEEGDVRIRDISSTGAMIEGIAFDGDVDGIDVMIELLEDQMFPARLRWTREGKAGMEFSETFNLERLNQPVSRLRRSK